MFSRGPSPLEMFRCNFLYKEIRNYKISKVTILIFLMILTLSMWFTIIYYHMFPRKIVRTNIRGNRGPSTWTKKRVQLCWSPFLVLVFVSTKYYGPQNALQICLSLIFLIFSKFKCVYKSSLQIGSCSRVHF